MLGKKILIPLGGGLPKNFKYVTALSMTIDDDYVLSTELIDQNGDIIGETQTVDLPLESMVVDGSYDSVNKMLILTLQNGNAIEVPIEDLIDGLVPDSRTIAGIPLTDDISSDDLIEALGVDTKVTKTNSANKIYGTDSSGEQTTYDKDSFGQVDDVQVNEVSVVNNKVANIDLNGYVQKTTTISGIDLSGNITAQDLTDNLVFATNADIEALFN